MRWQGSGSGSTTPLQLTVNGELNVVGVFEVDYDPSYVNVSGYVEIQGGNITYDLNSPQIFTESAGSETFELIQLAGLPARLSGGQKMNFTTFRVTLYKNGHVQLRPLAYLKQIANSGFKLTGGKIVIKDKDTGEIIPIESSYVSTNGFDNLILAQLGLTRDNALKFDYLKENSIQNIEIAIIFYSN